MPLDRLRPDARNRRATNFANVDPLIEGQAGSPPPIVGEGDLPNELREQSLYERIRSSQLWTSRQSTDRQPIGGHPALKNADEDALSGHEQRTVVPTHSGMRGPRGPVGEGEGVTPEVIAAGLPPAAGGPPRYSGRIPKEDYRPHIPYNFERYLDVTLPATVVNGTRLLDKSAAFPIRAMQVDNNTRLWLYVPSAARYIPPYVYGIQFPIFAASNKVEVLAAAPPGFTQQAVSTSEVFSVQCYEHELEFSPGILSPGAPGNPASATAVAGTHTPADATANPTDALSTEDFNMVWNGATWDRWSEAPATLAVNIPTTGIGQVLAVLGRASNNYAVWGTTSSQGDGGNGNNSAAASLLSYNGSTWDRNRNASATNLSTANAKGVQLVAPVSTWSVTNTPSTATQASASQAAGGAGVRHVCTSITAYLAAGGTAQTPIVVNLRDGATGAGTVLWSAAISAPVNSMGVVTISGLAIIGSANTAMTLEFAAAGVASSQETVTLTGYDVS